MSFFSSITKGFKSLVNVAKPLIGGFLGGGPVGAMGGAFPMPSIPSGPSMAGFAGPTFGSGMKPVAAGGGGFSGMLGAMAGRAMGVGRTRTKVGRLSGGMIPVGFTERMSPQGVIYLARQRRRRGISARDVSAFRRVNRLLHSIERPHRTYRRKS